MPLLSETLGQDQPPPGEGSWFDQNAPQVDPNLPTTPPPGSATPQQEPTAPAWAGQQTPYGGQYAGGDTLPPAASMGAQGDPVAFIRQWQATHPASANAPQEIIAALQAAGYNATPYMYGNTPSGNEINLNGEKFKVIGGENSGSPFWYRGEDDSGGGPMGAGGLPPGYQMGTYTGGGQYPLASVMGPGLMQPWTTPFTAPELNDSTDPGYLARFNLGKDAMEASAAARGTLLTGGFQKDLAKYAQDYASNEYDKIYGRRLGEYQMAYGIYGNNQNNQYNRLYQMAQLGLNGQNSLNNLGSSYMNNAGNLYGQQGDINAANTGAQARGTNNMIGEVGTLGQMFATYPWNRNSNTTTPTRAQTPGQVTPTPFV